MLNYDKGYTFRFVFPEGFRAKSPTCVITGYTGVVPTTTVKDIE